MSVTKAITTSRPFYVVAGASDLAAKVVREGTGRLASLRIERNDLERTITVLQSETRALPAKAQTVAVTLAADVAGAVSSGYVDLLGRGRGVVTRIRRQKASQDLGQQSATTARRSEATVTAAKKAVSETGSSAADTATTARKRAAGTTKTAKSAATSARKTSSTARKATTDAASKIGH